MIMMPQMNKPKYRPIRGLLFVILGISDTAPVFYLRYIA
jgi:hypothetical protein